jgi:NADH-quinone oxidoreductase subunit A
LEGSTVNPVVVWPLGVYFGLVVLLVGAMLGLSYLLGERHQGRTRGEPYESGIVPTGSARLRFDIKFYRTATYFVIFDLEAAFIFIWALSVRELGWPGYVEVVVFVVILVVALVYLWRVGALAWGTSGRRSARHKE